AASPGFTDIGGHRYETAIRKGYGLGIIDGTSPSLFSPDALLTREQAAKIMSALVEKLEAIDIDLTATPDFADNSAISPWAYPYVAFAKTHGIMEGVDQTLFGPKQNLTREQALTVAYRLTVAFEWV
ncbi:S-layer homology domain-containing protein, partial [Oscillospiraceae bacterium OttesenSCG-928-F05]|nr:S-layer homology domain-containing protein [Oscillospiraceae bacterium OttesenSCG-928-F05]